MNWRRFRLILFHRVSYRERVWYLDSEPIEHSRRQHDRSLLARPARIRSYYPCCSAVQFRYVLRLVSRTNLYTARIG